MHACHMLDVMWTSVTNQKPIQGIKFIMRYPDTEEKFLNRTSKTTIVVVTRVQTKELYLLYPIHLLNNLTIQFMYEYMISDTQWYREEFYVFLRGRYVW